MLVDTNITQRNTKGDRGDRLGILERTGVRAKEVATGPTTDTYK